MDINKEVEDHWKINGDRIKFKDLESASYDMIRGNLTKYAYGRLKNWQDAEDAVQEAYYLMLRFPPKGDDHNFGGIYKLTLDRTIAEIGSKNIVRNNVIDEGDDIEEENYENRVERFESDELNPDQAYDMVKLTSLIMDLSENLSMKKKHIVRLAMIFNYSYKEIEGITKSSTDQIRNVLKYFRQKVREHPRYEDIRI